MSKLLGLKRFQANRIINNLIDDHVVSFGLKRVKSVGSDSVLGATNVWIDSFPLFYIKTDDLKCNIFNWNDVVDDRLFVLPLIVIGHEREHNMQMERVKNGQASADIALDFLFKQRSRVYEADCFYKLSVMEIEATMTGIRYAHTYLKTFHPGVDIDFLICDMVSRLSKSNLRFPIPGSDYTSLDEIYEAFDKAHAEALDYQVTYVINGEETCPAFKYMMESGDSMLFNRLFSRPMSVGDYQKIITSINLYKVFPEWQGVWDKSLKDVDLRYETVVQPKLDALREEIRLKRVENAEHRFFDVVSDDRSVFDVTKDDNDLEG